MNEKHGAAEWLRGIIEEYEASGSMRCSAMAKMFGIVCEHERTCRDCITKMMTDIADRIEADRELPEGIEWPRFEGGELVKVGDELEYKGETMRVYLATFYADRWVLWCSREGIDGRLSGSFGERVKRPAPKVLAADGAPIEVGDVVYYDGEPHPLTVVGITRDGKDALVDANGEESCVEGGRPQDFSHDAPKPVLDAGGVPIEVGDTVYLNGGDEPLRVSHITDSLKVVLVDNNVSYFTVNPSRLSHERPDSWEKLEEDVMRGTSCRYFRGAESASDCCDCPHGTEQTGTTCWRNERIDILKRAKKLAGIEEEARND